MPVYAFTSFSYSYLGRARVLARTLKSHHPDWQFWAVLTDKEPDGFSFNLLEEDFDGLLTAEDLFGEEAASWLFTLDIVEACTAVKGKASVEFLNQPECDKLLYFDPDMAIFNPMDEVIDLLDRFSIILTPHQVDPEQRGDHIAIKANEIASLNYGVFNLGFIAIANDTEGRRFAKWWDYRLRDWCHDRLDIGVFVDQKWCNLVPCFFDNVKVLRDPGYNVASWNLSQRKISFDEEGTARVNGSPLRFYHFTKFGSIGASAAQRFAGSNSEVYELWWWYQQQVIAANPALIPKGWWYYGQFDNGKKIPKSARELYRDRADIRKAFPEPFRTGDRSFYQWLCVKTDLMREDVEKKGFQPV